MTSFLYVFADSLLFGNTQRQDPMGDGSRLSARFDAKGKGRASPANGDILALDLGSAEEGTAQNGDAFMQMQLVEQQVGVLLDAVLEFRSSCSFLIGFLYSIAFNGHRIYRVDNRRARPDLYSAGADGSRTARDNTENRCGYCGYCRQCQWSTTGAIEVLCQHLK